MAQRIVLFALRNWLGPPRLPQALQRAGFEVAVVCPAGSFLSLTRHVNERVELRSGAIFRDIFAQLWRLVTEWGAGSVIAVDDLAVQRFYELAQAVHDGKAGAARGKDLFVRMLRRSLPPPEHFDSLLSKQGMHRLALSAGIAAPAQAACATAEAALIFAKEHGHPVVLKTERGAGGVDVVICKNAAALRETFVRMPGVTLLAESYVGGAQISYPFVAERGCVLTGLTRLKLKAHPEPLGPSSVVELINVPAAAEAAARFAAACQYSGFASIQFLLDAKTRTPQFLEFNPRPVPMMHMGEALAGIDWCRAWHEQMAGQPLPQFSGPKLGKRIALFPQEWLRDPNSDFLKTGAVQDIVQNDPVLAEAYLR